MIDTHLFLGASESSTQKGTGLVFVVGRDVTLGIFYLPPELAPMSHLQAE